jgi:hypothetical protein
MKAICKNPKIITQRENLTIYERVKMMKEIDIKIKLFEAFLLHYRLCRYYRKKVNLEIDQIFNNSQEKDKDRASVAFEVSPNTIKMQRGRRQCVSTTVPLIQKSDGDSGQNPTKKPEIMDKLKQQFEGGMTTEEEDSEDIDQIEEDEQEEEEVENEEQKVEKSSNTEEESASVNYSISSYDKSQEHEDSKLQALSEIQDMSSQDLRSHIKKNKRDIEKNLKEYFLQRSFELQKENDFYIEKGLYNQNLKRRKPTTHFDLIIEEYLNLRYINLQIHNQNIQNMRAKYFSQDPQGDITRGHKKQSVVVRPFELAPSTTHHEDKIEDKDLNEAYRIQKSQDEMFKPLYTQQFSNVKRHLKMFRKQFDRKISNLQKQQEKAL